MTLKKYEIVNKKSNIMTCVELEYVVLGDILSSIFSYFSAYRTTFPLIQIQVRTIVNDKHCYKEMRGSICAH